MRKEKNDEQNGIIKKWKGDGRGTTRLAGTRSNKTTTTWLTVT